MEFDEAGGGARDAFALGEYGGDDMHRIAMEERRGKLHIRHAEIGDGGAEGRVIDRDADHQPECEEAVDEGFAEFGLRLGEVPIDMQWLRVVGHGREQHIVHLRDRAANGMVEDLPDIERLVIEPCHLVPLVWLRSRNPR